MIWGALQFWVWGGGGGGNRGPHHLDDLGDLHWSVGGGNGEERLDNPGELYKFGCGEGELDDLGGSTILGVGRGS